MVDVLELCEDPEEKLFGRLKVKIFLPGLIFGLGGRKWMNVAVDAIGIKK